MAITWGAWKNSGGNGMRVGIDVTVPSVSTSTTSITIVWKIYTQNQYTYSDDQTLSWSQSASGSVGFRNSSGSGSVLRRTVNVTYTYSTWGSSPGTRSLTARISGAFNGVTPSQSRTVTLPARPITTPNAPTSVALRGAGTTTGTTTWAESVTAQRPVTSFQVQARVFQGSAWGAYASTVSVAASGRSQAYTGQTNRVLQTQVRANNGAGSSGWVASNTLYFTPGAPSAASAAASGAQVVVRFTPTTYQAAGVTHQIQRSNNGAAWVTVTTGLSYSANTWTDTAPPSGSNQYQVRAYLQANMGYTGAPALGSAWKATNTVTAAVAPRAPSGLAPNGVTFDADTDTVVATWTHNHGGDAAPQAGFELRWSADNGTTWQTTGQIASTASTYTFPAGVLVNGQSYTWQVRTRSNNGLATYGPYSTSAHFQMQAFDPDAPPPPVNAALVPLPQVLGTGTSRAFIYDQRGEQRILELSNVSSLSWSRRINEVSDASVIVDVPGGGEREECCGDLGNIHVWHHSLVIFREVDGTPQRVWEGPIRRLGYRPGQVTIDARDVSGWLEHRRRHTYRDVASSPVTTEMMLSLQRAFTSPVVTSPAETSDPNVLPWVINYGTLTEPVSMGPAVSRDVLPNEAFYIDDLNSFVDMGGRWTVLGRSIIVFHDGIALGRTNTLLPSRDLQAEIEIVEDGDSLTTYGVARDDTGAAQAYYGPTGHTPIDAYYGLLDSVVSLGGGDTGASRAALIAAATAVWNQNYPAPILLNIPQDSTLSCDAPFPMQHLVCGTIVPIESTETCRDVSATMILSGVQVEQTAEGEQVAISLIPSSQRTTGIQGATFALDGLGLAPAAPVQFLPEPAATEPATQEVD